jgi:hypothetical protein
MIQSEGLPFISAPNTQSFCEFQTHTIVRKMKKKIFSTIIYVEETIISQKDTFKKNSMLKNIKTNNSAKKANKCSAAEINSVSTINNICITSRKG